jgi:hypothetical protein
MYRSFASFSVSRLKWCFQAFFRLGIAFCVLLPVIPAKAQIFSEFLLRHLTVHDGLSSNHMNSIAQDEGGVWIGGLAPDTRVITLGQDYVVDGQAVAPVAAPERQAEARP